MQVSKNAFYSLPWHVCLHLLHDFQIWSLNSIWSHTVSGLCADIPDHPLILCSNIKGKTAPNCPELLCLLSQRSHRFLISLDGCLRQW